MSSINFFLREYASQQRQSNKEILSNYLCVPSSIQFFSLHFSISCMRRRYDFYPPHKIVSIASISDAHTIQRQQIQMKLKMASLQQTIYSHTWTKFKSHDKKNGGKYVLFLLIKLHDTLAYLKIPHKTIRHLMIFPPPPQLLECNTRINMLVVLFSDFIIIYGNLCLNKAFF